MRVALIYGGEGYEREVSILGFRHLFPIFNELYDTLPIIIDTEGAWYYKTERVFPTEGGFYSARTGELYPCDIAFPLLHGDMGEDGVVQGALRVAKIPYVGCPSTVGAVCRDKTVVKSVARGIDIPTLPWELIARGERPTLPLPLFIKPTSLGSSMGGAVARSEGELESALKAAFALTDRVMAEPYIESKRELECGYFATKSKELFTNPGEILTEGFYDYEAKYKSKTKILATSDLDEGIRERIKDYTRRLVRALGVRQIARIDYFLTEGEIYFNEINTMPGFTEDSLYQKMLEASGVPIKTLIKELVAGAL